MARAALESNPFVERDHQALLTTSAVLVGALPGFALAPIHREDKCGGGLNG